MSSSLPNRSAFPEESISSESNQHNYNYTIFSDNIKNPPKLTASDDGSGTASNPKNIINNRRRSESFAVYSGHQDYLATSPSQNSFNEIYFNTYNQSDEVPSSYFSPEALQQNLFPHNLNVDKKIVLYKTEMCRTFEETGTCKYGTKCQFAHDPNEIRNIPRHPRYKTEICKTFWQLGNCPYGKRCCFIHTENELRDQRKSTGTIQVNNDIYGSADLTITEDVGLNEIQSQNSSRSASPNKLAEAGKIAEDLKKAISNIGDNSIFNDLPKMSKIRRKSILDDKIDELAFLVGSNCSINPKETADSAAPNSEDPEFKSIYENRFELWTCDSPDLIIEEDKETKVNTTTTTTNNNNKFTLFDKSPGSRAIDAFSNGIWSKGSLNANTFISDSQYFKSVTEEAKKLSTVSSGASSSKSNSNNHQQLLIDMLNLLDSA